MYPPARRNTAPRAPPRPATALLLLLVWLDEGSAVTVEMMVEETTVGGSIAQGVPQQVRLFRPLRRKEQNDIVSFPDARTQKQRQTNTYQQYVPSVQEVISAKPSALPPA